MRSVKIHIIMGGTGIGKTGRAVRIARAFDAPVIVIDRYQVFRDLSVGTGRPPDEELAGTTRIYLDDRVIEDGELIPEEAYDLLAEILSREAARRDVVILEGGSISLWTLVMERRLLCEHDVVPEYMRFDEDPAYLLRMSDRVRKMVVSPAGSPSVIDEIALVWTDDARRAFVERIVGYDAIAACCRWWQCGPRDLCGPSLLPKVVDAIVLSHATYAERQRKVFDRLTQAHLAPAIA